MIVRVVLVHFAPPHRTPDKRSEIAAHARRVFPTIPGVQKFHVGTPASSPDSGDVDLMLCIGFDSLEDVQRYISHDIHVAFKRDYLTPFADSLTAQNFEIPEPFLP